jgi:BMFP domain-containing protein YqiC
MSRGREANSMEESAQNISVSVKSFQRSGGRWGCFPDKTKNSAIRRDSNLVFCGVLRYQPPMTKESIEELASKLAESVPEGIRLAREDLHKNFKSVLQSGIARLDLVTREEFEIQEAVLARTRQKLEALESRLQQLESGKKKAKKKASKRKASTKKT